MPPVDESSLDSYPDTPLKLAMRDRGMSIRGLARLLAPDGDEKTWSSVRKQIRSWLEGGQPRPETGQRLAAALELPEGYFIRTPRAGDLRAEVAELRERLEALESQIRPEADGPPPTREASARKRGGR